MKASNSPVSNRGNAQWICIHIEDSLQYLSTSVCIVQRIEEWDFANRQLKGCMLEAQGKEVKYTRIAYTCLRVI